MMKLDRAGHSTTTGEPSMLGLVPMVIETSGRGERAYDIHCAFAA